MKAKEYCLEDREIYIFNRLCSNKPPIKGFYSEDVKEFIQQLKEDVFNLAVDDERKFCVENINELISKRAGEKLI